MSRVDELVIVGGGPVGLSTAIQLKKRRPDWPVTVYERHETYQRSHVLRLDHWSLLLYGRNRRNDARDEAFFREVTGKRISSVAWRFASSLFIRTNDLEAAYKRYAKELGVEIRHQRIHTPTEVRALHPRCSRFIAADGAHSGLRRALLGEYDVQDHPLQHVVEVKYEVEGDAARLGALNEQFSVNQRLEHLAFEYVGRTREGRTPVTLRFFVDESLYRALPPASFKEPLAVDSPALPARLRRDIDTYMRLRMDRSSEAYCRSSGRVTKLVLSLYSARKFALTNEGVGWFLVGDAAMGVPYFRALNCGLILSNRLCQILASSKWPLCGELSQQVKFYQVHRPLHIATEFGIARSKNFALQAFDWMRQLMADDVPQSSGQELQPFDLSWAPDCRAPERS